MKHKTTQLLLSSLIVLILLVTSCTQTGTEDEELNIEETTQELDAEEEVVTEVEDETEEDVAKKEAEVTIEEGVTSPDVISRSGWIYEDETWSGIVHITGDTWVEGEVTITILPGTRVIFTAHQDDQPVSEQLTPIHDEWTAANNDPTISQEYVNSHSKLDVYGTLIARGTSENRIIFTSDSPTPDGGDWEHLHIGYGSVIEYCIIEYSLSAIDVKEHTEDSVLITNNIIRHNLWTGLTIQHHSSPTITHNEIWDSGGHQGIAVVGEGTAPYIAYNVIKECLSGMNITPGTSPTVEYNTLIDNDSGIGVIGPNTTAIIRHNSISSPNGPSQNWTYRSEPVYFSSILLGRNDAISGISVSDCSPVITNNSISECNSAGINIMGNASPTIKHNTITDCHTGFLLDESFDGSPSIEENNIYDNSYANISLWSIQSISATNNWWGTAGLAEIQAKMLNMQGQPALDMIIIEPTLLQPVKTD